MYLKGFGDILNLVPLAESVVKLAAVCMICCHDASFTKRRGNETQVSKTENFFKSSNKIDKLFFLNVKIELIGGEEAYLAVCRNCFFITQENDENNLTAIENKKQLNDLTNINSKNSILSSSPSKIKKERQCLKIF